MFNRFRHATWIIDSLVFTFGGCDYTDVQRAINSISVFDLQSLKARSKSPEDNANKNFEKQATPTLLSSDDLVKQIDFKTLHDEFNKEVIRDNKTIKNEDNLNEQEGISIQTAEISRSKGGLHQKPEKLEIQGSSTYFYDKEDPLYEQFIKYHMNPKVWKNISSLEEGVPRFVFATEHIVALIKACQEVVVSQEIVIKLKTPVKVFGDIHGQFDDLMRFFEYFGNPLDDIQAVDYLFLGDYVDRGFYSLEVICLLMSLKLKYPDKVYLIRGNHEDRLINSSFGFKEECMLRIVDENGETFNAINDFFEYLPLACVIDDEILCLHGGIGFSFSKISDLEELQRPLKVVHDANSTKDQLLMDILWSDPTESDEELGIQPNLIRDSSSFGHIVRFGPDIVEKFLLANNLSLIIRAHECVMDGIERFANGCLITVFSATNYCRRHGNAGGMLIVKQNHEIVPYLIYPVDDEKKKWIEDPEYLEKRPPTPPRLRKAATKT